MTIRRARGFTLIELLVVIAIIGILAAMLFPVFARARESARKIQCLSNVKNIAMAIQMYFTDYDRGWPREETRPEVLQYFNDLAGGSPGFTDSNGNCRIASDANPYLRRPTILDEYIKNRDVWHCPSARIEQGPGIIVGDPNWFREFVNRQGEWGSGTSLCPKDTTFPNGWGGTVTDSFIQGVMAQDMWGTGNISDGHAGFTQSIGVNYMLDGASPSSMGDAASFVACHEAGPMLSYTNPGMVAYPDLCKAECNCEWSGWPCEGYCDWEEFFTPADGSMARDPDLMKPFTRHLGGSNIGFMDGHAAWWTARAWVSKMVELGQKGERYPMGMEPWAGGYPTMIQDCGFTPDIAMFYKP